MKSPVDYQQALRKIPSVQDQLQNSEFLKFPVDAAILKQIIQQETQKLRKEITGQKALKPAKVQEVLRKNIQVRLLRLTQPSLRRVINATGVILHTNLGRAPLPKNARNTLHRVIENYCNLEYNLDTGAPGDRSSHVEELLCLLTGAEAALVVNNNAAAVLLTLNSLAKRKEVPVSRGELVEIGGSYRMPDVMKSSGVKMVEVGTTNKTHMKDYQNAINQKTAALLKVHTSNYRVMGFSSEVSLPDLAELAHQHNLPVIYDMGSGALVGLSRWGLPDEPLAGTMVDMGVDVITFSGDKVLGGPQSGIIIGKRALITKIKKNNLTSALRCDKMTYAVLNETLRCSRKYYQKKFLFIPCSVLQSMNWAEEPGRLKKKFNRPIYN
ncbi:MAG: L-seryl-tRNA(Sec) selenium transferase [Calditrichia bacterium]